MQLKLNVKPITLNHYRKTSFKNKGGFKSPAAKQFEKEMSFALAAYSKQIAEFNKLYCSKKSYIVANYLFYLPFITKSGTVAKQRHDVDNFIKPVNDQIFKHLNADDSEIVSLTATKVHSKTPGIVVELSVKDLTYLQ